MAHWRAPRYVVRASEISQEDMERLARSSPGDVIPVNDPWAIRRMYDSPRARSARTVSRAAAHKAKMSHRFHYNLRGYRATIG
jgi:hypothetical protein